ncbi:hypothetical protein [Demequina sp. NBRC 110052]|uniref:hypothetical protein n=1 Tax=Demequina sp. NBRC 110052 TaxID=1570341 RepID=UPI0009FECB13|nr:hypothetical protein [Demequina sp. NBRC 110052]
MLSWAEVRARIDALGLPSERVVLMGSGPMVAHGLVESVGDVDLVASDEAWERATRLAPPTEGLHGDLVVRLGDVEVFSGWHGTPAAALLETATLIDGILVGTLADVLEFKLALKRPKDATHIALLRAALGAPGAADESPGT